MKGPHLVGLALILAALAAQAVAPSTDAAAQVLHATGPGAIATWVLYPASADVTAMFVGEQDFISRTSITVTRQQGGPRIDVMQEMDRGELGWVTTTGSARATLSIEPGLASVSVGRSIVPVHTCGDAGCEASGTISVAPLTWTGTGAITTETNPTHIPPPPPFCFDRWTLSRRDAVLHGASDPFGRALGPLGELEGASIFKEARVRIDVGGACP